ncbi:MAG: hypothetical protein M3Q10_09595, partial [Chloroflexota bacterium]|nr:hypothetical protein [Chloroflexota bacterium]
MERIEPSLQPRREPDQPFAAEPKLQLDGLSHPLHRHPRLGRESHRRFNNRPAIARPKLPYLPVARDKGPRRDDLLRRVAPCAQLGQPLRRSLDPPLVD